MGNKTVLKSMKYDVKNLNIELQNALREFSLFSLGNEGYSVCAVECDSNRTETDGATLLVSGADLLDGTPILDIKPYLPFADCIPEATAGYAGEHQYDRLNVVFPPDLLQKIPTQKQAGLLDCLADDPRPSYQEDGRIYGMRFADFEIKFTVADGILTVINVEQH